MGGQPEDVALFSYHTFDIETPFLFAPETSDLATRVAALPEPDRRQLIYILIRARLARKVGIEIPIETLLAREPL